VSIAIESRWRRLRRTRREQGKAADLLNRPKPILPATSAVEEITKATRDRFDRIDILVNKRRDWPRCNFDRIGGSGR